MRQQAGMCCLRNLPAENFDPIDDGRMKRTHSPMDIPGRRVRAQSEPLSPPAATEAAPATPASHSAPTGRGTRFGPGALAGLPPRRRSDSASPTPRSPVGPLRVESAAETSATLHAVLASLPPDAALLTLPPDGVHDPVQMPGVIEISDRRALRAIVRQGRDLPPLQREQFRQSLGTQLLAALGHSLQPLTARALPGLPDRYGQFYRRFNMLTTMSGPRDNSALLPLLSELRGLQPEQQATALGMFFDRLELDDPDPQQALLCGVIGAVAELPDPVMRDRFHNVLDGLLLLVADEHRDKPMAAFLGLLPHLPADDARCATYLSIVSDLDELHEAGRAHVIDRLIEHIDDLPEGPYRMAAVSHLLLQIRTEAEPASIRHLAAIAAKVPLLSPGQRMLDILCCIGQIAQLTSLPGRCAVLTAMAQSLPQLVQHEFLKQGILIISRFGALGDEQRQKRLTAQIESSMLQVARRIERRVQTQHAHPQADALTIRQFSALVDGAVIAPTALREKVASSIMSVVLSAQRHASPTLEALRNECDRKLASDICNELGFRLGA